MLSMSLWARFVSWLKKLNYPAIAGIGAIHILAFFALWDFSRFYTESGGWICFALCVVAGFGIGLCYHRLLTHGSYKTEKWFRNFLTICGTLAFEGGPMKWVGTHRIHHEHSDKEGDPHSPKKGFDWAHIFWLFYKGVTQEDIERVTKDLQKEPFMVFISRYFWLTQITVTVVLLAIGFLVGGTDTALSWLFWGVGVRTAIGYHTTWSVNSFCHLWGSQRFQTGDSSRNVWWLALFTLGESWHNNHHKFQTSAAHGLRWYELDPTYYVIRLLGFIGLARDIKTPDQMKIAEMAAKKAA